MNPFALRVENRDTFGPAVNAFAAGRQVNADRSLSANGYAASRGDESALSQLYADNPAAAGSIDIQNQKTRLSGLQSLANMGREIMRLTDPNQKAAAVEQAKGLAARMYGLDPSAFDYVTPDTIDDLTATVETEAQRLMEQMGLVSAGLGIQNQQLGLEGQRLENQTRMLGLDTARRQQDYYSRGGAFGPGASVTPSVGTGSPAAPGYEGYESTLIRKESGGNPGAKNPYGSAAGLGQFIDSTWSTVVNSPAGRAAGLTMDGRTDPVQGRMGINILTHMNADTLTAAGIPITGQTLRLAHFLGGAGAVKAINADPNASAEAVFPTEARYNPGLMRGKTVGQMIQAAVGDFSPSPIQLPGLPGVGGGNGVGAQPAFTPPSAPAMPGSAPVQPSPDRVVIEGQRLPAAGAVPAGAPPVTITPPAGPPPLAISPASAAPAQPQSVVTLAQNDPVMIDLNRRMMQAQSVGDTQGANTLGSMMEARMKELAAQLPPILSPKDQAKADAVEAKASAADQATLRDAQQVMATIDDAIARASEPNDFRTGTMGSVMAGIMPGSGADKLNALLDTIKANLSFEKLAEMRRNSPTGGALGSITERELELLGSAVAALRVGLGDDLTANLKKVKEHYQRVIDALAGAPLPGGTAIGAPPDDGVIRYDANGNRM